MIDCGLVQVLISTLSGGEFQIENDGVASNANFRWVERNMAADNGIANVPEGATQTLKNLLSHFHDNVGSEMYRELVPLVIWLLGRLSVGRVNTTQKDETR